MPRAGYAVILVGLLLAPTFGFSAIQAHRTGFFGLTARGADHAASRAVILVDPEKVLRGGADALLVERVFRPLHDSWSAKAWTHGAIEPGSPEVHFPLARDTTLIAAGAPTLEQVLVEYMRETDHPVTPYTVAALASHLVPLSLRSDPAPILKSVLAVVWDYVRLPFMWNYYGEARFQIYLWPVIWLFLLITL